MNACEKAIREHLADSAARIVIACPGARRQPIYSAADLPKIKSDGNGVRIGKTYIFPYQVRYARIR